MKKPSVIATGKRPNSSVLETTKQPKEADFPEYKIYPAKGGHTQNTKENDHQK